MGPEGPGHRNKSQVNDDNAIDLTRNHDVTETAEQNSLISLDSSKSKKFKQFTGKLITNLPPSTHRADSSELLLTVFQDQAPRL